METERLLLHAFLDAHPDEATLILERCSAAEVAAVFAETPPQMAAAILRRMGPFSGAACLADMAAVHAGPIVALLPLELAAGLLRRVEAHVRERVLADVPPQTAAPLRLLLQYPEGTAGALMDPQILVLPEDITASEAVERVRQAPRNVFAYLYIVNRAHVLVGVLNLRELMLAPPDVLLVSVMRPHVARLSARADRIAIMSHPGWKEFHALPVVDDADTFLGVIRYQTRRRLEDHVDTNRQTQSAVATFLTLGELYWVSLSRVLVGLMSAFVPPPRPPDAERRPHHGC